MRVSTDPCTWPLTGHWWQGHTRRSRCHRTHLLHLQGLWDWAEQLLLRPRVFMCVSVCEYIWQRVFEWLPDVFMHNKRVLMLELKPLWIHFRQLPPLCSLWHKQRKEDRRRAACVCGSGLVCVCVCVCWGGGGIIRLHFTLPDNPSTMSKAYSAAWWLVFSRYISMY